MSWITSPLNALKAAGTGALLLAESTPLGGLTRTVTDATGNPIDVTPGYSATNVLKTQLGGSETKSSPKDSSSTTPNNSGDDGTGGQVSTSALSGTNGSGYTAAEVATLGAQYDSAIEALRKQLGLLDTTEQQGRQELTNTYQNQLGQGVAKYGTQRTDNDQSRLKTLEGVDTSARSGYEGLKRMLGLSGSANQSALKNAKMAVSKVASGKRSDAIDMYGKNSRDIDTAEAQFKQNLLDEKNQREKSFLQGLLEQKNSLQNSLGQNEANRAALTSSNYDTIRAAYAPSQAAIDANNLALNDITKQYATPLNTTATTPELSQYTVDQTAIDANNQTGNQSDYSPYSAFLLRKKLTGQA